MNKEYTAVHVLVSVLPLKMAAKMINLMKMTMMMMMIMMTGR